MKKTYYLLIFSLFYALNSWASPDSLKFPEPKDSLLEIQIDATVSAFKIQKAINDKNNKEGKSYLNSYIIFPETSPYIRKEDYNGGQSLWESVDLAKIDEMLKIANGQREEGEGEHYLIIASVYNYYYDVEYYEKGKKNILSDKDPNWEDPSSVFESLSDEEKQQYKDKPIPIEVSFLEVGDVARTYINKVNERESDKAKNRKKFFNAFAEGLNADLAEESETSNKKREAISISLVVTFYDWGIDEKTKESNPYMWDYFKNFDVKLGDKTPTSSSNITDGFRKWVDKYKPRGRDKQKLESFREQALLKLIQLTLGYFDIVEDENQEYEIRTTQGRHFIGLLLKEAARYDLDIFEENTGEGLLKVKEEYREKFTNWGKAVDDLSDLRGGQESPLAWVFYIGYLNDLYKLNLKYEIMEEGLLIGGDPIFFKTIIEKGFEEVVFESIMNGGKRRLDTYLTDFGEIIDKINQESKDLIIWSALETGYWQSFDIMERMRILDRTNVSPGTVADLIDNMPDFQSKQLTVDQRVLIIKKLLEMALQDKRRIKAKTIVKIIESTPDEDGKKLLEEMIFTGALEEMFNELYVDALWLSQDALKEPIKELAYLWNRAYTEYEKEDIRQNAYAERKRWFKPSYYYSEVNVEDLYIDVTDYEFTFGNKIKFITQQSHGNTNGMDIPEGSPKIELEILPHEAVILEYRLEGKDYQQIVPAFMYAWMIKSTKTEYKIGMAELFVEIGSLILFPLIAPEAIMARRLIAGAQLAFIANRLIKMSVQERIIQERKDGINFINNWNKLTYYFDWADLALGGFDVAIDIATYWRSKKLDKLKQDPDYHRDILQMEKKVKGIEEQLNPIFAQSDQDIFNNIKKNKMVLTQKNDGILDVYIHHDKTNNKYIAWMDGEIKELDEKSLAKVINGKIEEIRKTEGIKNIETIRLLSCSDWESAKRFHKYINIDPDFDIHLQASNKKVELSFDPDSKELVGIQGGTWKEFTKEQEKIIQPDWNRGPPKDREVKIVEMAKTYPGYRIISNEQSGSTFNNIGDLSDDFEGVYLYGPYLGKGKKRGIYKYKPIINKDNPKVKAEAQPIFLVEKNQQGELIFSFSGQKGDQIQISENQVFEAGKFVDDPPSKYLASFRSDKPRGTWYLIEGGTHGYYVRFRRLLSGAAGDEWLSHQNRVGMKLAEDYTPYAQVQLEVIPKDKSKNSITIYPDYIYEDGGGKWNIVDAKYSEAKDLSQQTPYMEPGQKEAYKLISTGQAEEIRVIASVGKLDELNIKLKKNETITVNKDIYIYYNAPKNKEIIRSRKLKKGLDF